MNSVIKQCVINQLELPSELCNIIKDYCFYDILSWEMIQFIRYKKEVINDIFKNNVVSLANPYDVFDDLDQGHWVLWVDTIEDSYYCQFQACFCTTCGEYDPQYAPEYISRKIICDCEYDDDYYDEEHADHYDEEHADHYDDDYYDDYYDEEHADHYDIDDHTHHYDSDDDASFDD